MDKITYLKLKKEREEESKRFSRETFCYKCYKQEKNCLCHTIKSFDSIFQFVILIHPMEAKKEKMGTGRITHAYLDNSKLITGIDFTNNSEVNELIKNNLCYVMYPGDEAINVSSGNVEILKKQLEEKKIVIFLIDGTWPCAKKMMKLSTNLHHLPRISFDVTEESIFQIKEQPSKFCLSTIESVHLFLSECERRHLISLEGKHHQMLTTFKTMIDFQVKCANDPTLDSYRRKKSGFSNPKERRASKKWENRSIIFRGK